MNKYYELVIFTAAMQDYADWVLDNLDTNRIINYRLYRQHAVRNGAVFIKDMSKLGRDLSKVIIVDNVS
jgi:CTD small phosphatase-like protein 2